MFIPLPKAMLINTENRISEDSLKMNFFTKAS